MQKPQGQSFFFLDCLLTPIAKASSFINYCKHVLPVVKADLQWETLNDLGIMRRPFSRSCCLPRPILEMDSCKEQYPWALSK